MPSIPNMAPDPQLPEYRWNAIAGRYIDQRGSFVAADTIRAQLDKAIDSTADAMAAVSGRLQSGAISVAEWQTEMMGLIKEANLLGAASERGGWAHMTQADFGRAGRIIRDEYGYLRDFAAQIDSGKQPLDGTLARRARLYGQQGRATYYRFAHQDGLRRGFDEERSRLTPADHCETCVAEHNKSWQPMGEMIPIGSRDCRSNDRCYVEQRNSATGETRRV